jgi:uncharacterized damage-inducible protein DinB
LSGQLEIIESVAQRYFRFLFAFCSDLRYPCLAIQGGFAMDFQKELIAEYDQEIARTRKIFAAIPADVDFNFKPQQKSMSLGRLAGHASETAGEWAMHTLTSNKLEFPGDHKFEAYIPASTDALLTRFDEQTSRAKAALGAFKPESWDENWKFVYGDQAWIDDTKYHVWRNWVINHMVHHRAQLGVYLRVLGKPIPGMYGPSADES